MLGMEWMGICTIISPSPPSSRPHAEEICRMPAGCGFGGRNSLVMIGWKLCCGRNVFRRCVTGPLNSQRWICKRLESKSWAEIEENFSKWGVAIDANGESREGLRRDRLKCPFTDFRLWTFYLCEPPPCFSLAPCLHYWRCKRREYYNNR